MELDKNIIYERLTKKNYSIDKNKLIDIVNYTFDISANIIGDYDFKIPDNNKKMNPLIWEYGHFLFFWENLIIKNLDYNYYNNYILKLNGDYYDSFLISKENRYKYINLLKNKKELNKISNDIKKLILKVIDTNLNSINMYLIMLGCSHQHMHNESFIYSINYYKNLLIENHKNCKFDECFKINKQIEYNYNENIVSEIKLINIKGGGYIQGIDINNNNYFYFDNESPSFKTTIDDFKCSKYPITNWQFIKFVEDGGYDNSNLYSPEGYSCIKNINKKSNNMYMPYNWEYIDGCYYEKVFGKLIKLRYNHPVCVTWYEANAFCKLYNYRMLKEKEWEYMAESNENSNCDYNYPQSVLKERNKNMGVYGLYGNYWEWCEENIYPYDGYIIDPVYREMSYPFFGYKKICKGGAWCIPKFLGTRTYRNSQMPDCNYQFITFRVCN